MVLSREWLSCNNNSLDHTGALQPHSSIPVVSKYRVNFSEASVPNTGDTTSSLVKLHGQYFMS
ncbi:hypothetical protein DPMN_046095 [Dreissena polymorpha]|uniref:Uncharacterized protein n=1 Tax=Dreissena polymorpha TaxID=45954 RepID=A0A9D4D8Z5_DREPO|nr:hypothetical protein DPMN_046095 [Dreissena polymorpha]